MADDRKDNSIVSGPEPFRWPWQRATDLEIGVKARQVPPPSHSLGGDSTVGKPGATKARAANAKAAFKAHVAAAEKLDAPAAAAVAGARAWPVQFVVFVALIYHLLGPGAAFITNDDLGARGLLTLVDSGLPDILGVDVGRWLAPGAAAWMWQPLIAVGGAALLRLTALNTAQKDPLGAIWIAAAAIAVDTATWLFVGLKLWGTAFTAEEANALITLLKVEGGALLVLFFILAPRGKKRLGQTDADFNR